MDCEIDDAAEFGRNGQWEATYRRVKRRRTFLEKMSDQSPSDHEQKWITLMSSLQQLIRTFIISDDLPPFRLSFHHAVMEIIGHQVQISVLPIGSNEFRLTASRLAPSGIPVRVKLEEVPGHVVRVLKEQ